MAGVPESDGFADGWGWMRSDREVGSKAVGAHEHGEPLRERLDPLAGDPPTPARAEAAPRRAHKTPSAACTGSDMGVVRGDT